MASLKIAIDLGVATYEKLRKRKAVNKRPAWATHQSWLDLAT